MPIDIYRVFNFWKYFSRSFILQKQPKNLKKQDKCTTNTQTKIYKVDESNDES